MFLENTDMTDSECVERDEFMNIAKAEWELSVAELKDRLGGVLIENGFAVTRRPCWPWSAVRSTSGVGRGSLSYIRSCT